MARWQRAVRSGGLVAANHVVGAGITAVSALLLSKALGPNEFAIYALCTSLSGVLRIVSRMGINVSLLTRKEEPSEEDYGTALAAMLVSSAIAGAGAALLLPAIAQFSKMPGLVWPGVATAALVPLYVLPLPAATRLERQLHFQPVVIIELVAQVIGQVIGIALAFAGWGVWGPILGGAIRAVVLAVGPWLVIRRWPRLDWNASRALQMTRYGVGYVIATSAVQGRTFAILATVGRVMGQDAVGYMGLTLRAAGLVAPFRAAVARVILPALAPIANVPEKLRKGMSDAIETELLLSIPVTLIAVACYGPAVHLMLGPAWTPTIELFAWVAAASLLASVHANALSALHVAGHFAESVVSTLVSYAAVLALLVVAAPLAVAPGVAMMGLVPAGWVAEWLAHRRVGTAWSRNGLLWALGGAAACLAALFGPWLLVVSVACWGATWRAIRERIRATAATLRGVSTFLDQSRPA